MSFHRGRTCTDHAHHFIVVDERPDKALNCRAHRNRFCALVASRYDHDVEFALRTQLDFSFPISVIIPMLTAVIS